MKTTAEIWNEYYKNSVSFNQWPDEEVIRLYRHFNSSVEKKSKKILDIGCGTGRNLIFFKSEGFDITGIDSSSYSIEKCKLLVPDGKFYVKDISTFIEETYEESFDVILCWGVIHYLPVGQGVKLINKIFSLLVPDGMFLATFRTGDDSFFSSMRGEKSYKIDLPEIDGAEIIPFTKEKVSILLSKFNYKYIGWKMRTSIPKKRIVSHYFTAAIK